MILIWLIVYYLLYNGPVFGSALSLYLLTWFLLSFRLGFMGILDYIYQWTRMKLFSAVIIYATAKQY